MVLEHLDRSVQLVKLVSQVTLGQLAIQDNKDLRVQQVTLETLDLLDQLGHQVNRVSVDLKATVAKLELQDSLDQRASQVT